MATWFFSYVDTCTHFCLDQNTPISRHAKMSSRFFHGGDSDSDSSSSEEEELYEREEVASEAESSSEESDDEDDDDSSSDDDDIKGTGASRFLKPTSGGDDSDESDSDEGERTVKSAKDKRFEELQGTIGKIENAQKNQDWSIISTGMRDSRLNTGRLANRL